MCISSAVGQGVRAGEGSLIIEENIKFGAYMVGSGHPSSSHKDVLGFLARLCVGFYVKEVLVFPRYCMFLGIGNGFSPNTYGTCLGSCKG